MKKETKMIRTSILQELDRLGWSVLELSQKSKVRYQSINDYLKHDKELSSKNLEKIFVTLNLQVCKKLTELEKIEENEMFLSKVIQYYKSNNNEDKPISDQFL